MNTLVRFLTSCILIAGATGAAAPAAAQSVPAVTVTVNFSYVPFPATIVSATAYGMHTGVYDKDLVKNAAIWGPELAAIGVKTLRYPGGNDADNYHFSNNSMTPLYSSDTAACSNTGVEKLYYNPANNFGAWLTTAYKAAGADSNAIVTINYGSNVDENGAMTTLAEGQVCSNPATHTPQGTPKGAAAQVAYANMAAGDPDVVLGDDGTYNWGTAQQWASLRVGNGTACPTSLPNVDVEDLCTHKPAYGAKYWEIGNEIYGDGYSVGNWQEDLNAPYPGPGGTRENDPSLTPALYGSRARTFIDQMKSVDSSIKIGTVVDAGAFETGSFQTLCADNYDDLDFVSYHYYPVNGIGPNNEQWPAEALALPYSEIPATVNTITTDMVNAGCQTRSGATPAIFVTEMNAVSGTLRNGNPQANRKLDPMNGVDWRNIVTEGQFAADAYLTFLEQDVQNIDWVELHNNEFLSSDGNETKLGVYYGIQMANQMAPANATVIPCVTSDHTNVVCHASILPGGNYGILISNIGTGPITEDTQPVGYDVSVTVNLSGPSFPISGVTKYEYRDREIEETPIQKTDGITLPGTFTITMSGLSIVEYIIPK